MAAPGRGGGVLACVAGAALGQPRTLGADAPEAAERRYQLGVAQYRAGHYADAAREFAVALELQPGSARLAFNLARAQERAGDLARAIDAYTLYLQFAPAATDRAEVEATIAALRTLATETGELMVTSEPTGASIYLEGAATPLAMTPWPGQIPAGLQTVRVTLDGYSTWLGDVEVLPGRSTVVEAALMLRPATAGGAPEAAAEVEPEAGGRGWRIAGWSGVGLGVVGIALGVYFGVRAAETADSLDAAADDPRDRYDDLRSQLSREETALWISLVTGVALGGAGAWALWSAPDATGAHAVRGVGWSTAW